MVALVRATHLRRHPWAWEQQAAVKALSASQPPNAHPVQNLVREEIQESNQSGCQCPGERRAPLPPGPRSPAAVLTTPSQSTGRQLQAGSGARRAVAPQLGLGALKGSVENEALPHCGCPLHLDQDMIPLPGCTLLFPLCKMGRAGPQHLPSPTLGLALESAPKLNKVQMWKQEERQHKVRDSRVTNIDGELAMSWLFIYVLIIIVRPGNGHWP